MLCFHHLQRLAMDAEGTMSLRRGPGRPRRQGSGSPAERRRRYDAAKIASVYSNSELDSASP